MHNPSSPDSHSAGADARWQRDLRGAAGRAAMASAMLRRLVETGVTDRSSGALDELEQACSRVRSLLEARRAEVREAAPSVRRRAG